MTTIEEAKKYLKDNWEQGTECPCCGQLVKMYRRKLNSGMAYGLIEAYKMDGIKNGDYYHVNELLEKKIAAAQLEMPRLRYWGLMEAKPNYEDPSKRDSGFWRITAKGKLFVKGELSVPSHILIYNGKLLGFEGGNTTIREALGSKFDYGELMGYFRKEEADDPQVRLV